MKKNIACAAAVLAIAFSSQAAFADDTQPTPDLTITGSVAVASQYRFRGISQSDNKPVIQGALTVAHKSGFYVSTWGSSASAGQGAVNIGGTEIDVYGGYTHGLGKTGLTFDGGLYGYIYPGATTGNYFEIYGSLTKAIGPFSVKGGINYAPSQNVFNYNVTSKSRENTYVYGEATFAVPHTAATLHGHIGHTGGGFDYTKQFIDFTAGVGYKWRSLTLDLSAVGTNVSKADALRMPITSPYQTWRPARTAAVLSLTAGF